MSMTGTSSPSLARKRRLQRLFFAAALVLVQTAQVVGQSGGVSTDVEIASLLDEIEVGTSKQERIDREIADLNARRDQTRLGLRTQVRSLYRITHSGLAPLAGGMDAVLRHVARVKRLRRLVERQAGLLGSFESRTKTLRAQSGEVAQSLQSARTRLTSLQSAPSSMRSGSFVPDADSLARGAGDSYGVHLVDPAPVARFESARGSLGSPVTGDVRIVPGRRAESDGPGLEFQAPVGTAVRAVAAGRVAFSDRYGSYGRLVILDHGDGFYTVYGGLGSVEVRVGDDLSRQARIGSIGTDFSPSALFFEVRKGTRTLEPRSWLGL
jgi:septal ring factor EnvC (AmiA/AmiB activator)